MKTVLTYLIFTTFLLGQSTTIIQNKGLLRDKVNHYVIGDTLHIKAEIGTVVRSFDIMKRQKRHTVSVMKSYPEYGINKLAIPMYLLPQGTYTVDLLHGNGNHYPFTLIRLERLETPLMSSREVIGYRAEYGTVQNFGAYTGRIDRLGKEKMHELIQKYSTDKLMRNGINNWLKIYTIYNDSTEVLEYQIK